MTTTRAGRLAVRQDRTLVRTRWHSKRFVVAHVSAPEADGTHERPPVNLAFVIDRSGSMSGKPIQLAMQAVEEAIGRLKPTDRFGVVVYDDRIDTVVPSMYAVPDARRVAIERLREIDARGSTNLGGGWLAGCELVAGDQLATGVNRVLLLTDGLANVGMTSPDDLATHALELRKRGVSTSTFGVGDRFDERLLQGMAQAGGGQFYDIASAERIRDHIASEVGETLEVVARDVSLDVVFPAGVRVEALGAFSARVTQDRAVIDLGDLVSGQELDVPLRLSFPFGDEGSSALAVFALTDADGAFTGTAGRLAWTYADDRANDRQPREREVDRIIAAVYAARTRREAVALNRDGRYDRAREALQATGRKIRAYAGDDPALRRIVDELMAESERFRHDMPERDRKVMFALSSNVMRSRDVQGKAMRRG